MSRRLYSAGDFDYWIAGREDEPLVRGILASRMHGAIQLSLQREPDAFGAGFGALAHDFILARNRRSEELVGVCERVVRECFVNGEVRRLPYLAALRVVPGYRHRLLALRGGFEAVRRLLGDTDDLPWSLTSIMGDNAIAQRLLGANLRGMPRYEPLGELSTFALSAMGHAPADRATLADLPALSELLMRQARARQFTCAWTPDALRAGIAQGWLRIEDFLVLREGGSVRACAVVWDQSAYRQIVVSGYAPWLARVRPLINLAARLSGWPRLPRAGEALSAAYLSLVAASDDDLFTLISLARAQAHRRGIGLLLFGHATGHPLTGRLRALPRQREYRSQLYCVRWPDTAAPMLDATLPLAPELALL